MYRSSLSVNPDDESESCPEHAGVVPVGISALLRRDTTPRDARSPSSPPAFSSPSASHTDGASSPRFPAGGASGGGSIPSLFLRLPPLDAPNQPLLKEGFLHKIGGNVKNWKTRYFRLFPGRLLYYKDGELMNAESRLGSILLPGASLAIFSGDVHAGHPFCFGVTPPDSDRQYILDADSVAHRNEWIAALMPETKQRLRMGGAESVREGFLVKLGGNVKNWKRRYVILTRNSLRYYPSCTDLDQCLGIIQLGAGFTVSADDAGAVSEAEQADANSGNSSNPYNFTIRATGSERTYIFSTNTRAERDGWTNALTDIQKGKI